MEALTKLLAVALPLLMLALLGMGMLLIYLAGKTMLEAKRIDLVSVAIVILILLLIPVGIREYPPMLTDAFIDAWVAIWGKSDEIEAITDEIINKSSERWFSNNEPTPPAILSTVFYIPPTYTPTPNTFEETATAYFEDFPTALPAQPTATPMPEYTATWSLQDFEAQATVNAANNPTPRPTVCVASRPGDLQRGCVPPTPIPGN